MDVPFVRERLHPPPRDGQKLRRKRGVGLVHEDGRPGQLVEAPERGRTGGGERFEERDGGRYDDWRIPSDCEVAGRLVVEVGQVVDLGDDFVGVFSREDERLPIDLGGLADNVGKGENDENATKPPFAGDRKKMGHHGRRLSRADGTVARDNLFIRRLCAASRVDGAAQCVSFGLWFKPGDIVVGGSKPLVGKKRRLPFTLNFIKRPIWCRGIGVVGIDEARERHSKKDRQIDRRTFGTGVVRPCRMPEKSFVMPVEQNLKRASHALGRLFDAENVVPSDRFRNKAW